MQGETEPLRLVFRLDQGAARAIGDSAKRPFPAGPAIRTSPSRPSTLAVTRQASVRAKIPANSRPVGLAGLSSQKTMVDNIAGFLKFGKSFLAVAGYPA